MVYTLRFFNAVCFIILTYLVPVLFTFYIQDVLKLKKNNSGNKSLSVFHLGTFSHLPSNSVENAKKADCSKPQKKKLFGGPTESYKIINFDVYHPEVLNTHINKQRCISQTQQSFILFIIVLGRHVSILIESASCTSNVQILT